MLHLLDYRGQTTKARIVQLLGETWPLTKKRVHNALKREYNIQVTYQAIHRAVNELLDEGIIGKDGREYFLSPKWIEQIANSANALLDKYTRNNKITTAKQSQELTFGSMKAAWDFLLEKANSTFFGESDACYIQMPRLFAVPISDAQVRLIREFARKTKVFLLCRRNGPVEKLAANFLRKLGVEVYLGLPCAQPINVTLIGDCVISIHVLYKRAEHANLDNFYYSIKNILKQDIFNVFSAFIGKDIKVKITIKRDPEVHADILAENRKLLKGIGPPKKNSRRG